MANKYKPFLNIGPGFFIDEELETRGWSRSDLAMITGINPSQVSDIIHNKRPITLETAKLLSKAFGQSPQYWLNLYTNYKLREEDTTAAESATEIKANILTHMPISDMVKKGWLPKWNGNLSRLVKSVKEFWGIQNLDFSFMDIEDTPAFRKSEAFEKYNIYYAMTWYQMAKKCASQYKVEAYDKKGLEKIASRISEYSYYRKGIKNFIEDLGSVGVKFFALSHLEKTYTDGAAFWDENNPVIVWTARYKREDNFWFTVTHEIAHILLHLKDKMTFFIDSEEMELDEREQQANEFAENAIMRSAIQEYLGYGKITKHKVLACAEELKMSPALIVGQLHHMQLIKPYQLRNLIESDITGEIPKEYYGLIKVA